MKINNIFTLLILTIFLVSCQGAKDALQSKKRSNTNEQFLVKKKTPLTSPPDINELPVPLEEEDQVETGLEPEIKKILKIESDQTEAQNSSNSNSSLEQSIIEKINN
jgi:hypothetical protein